MSRHPRRAPAALVLSLALLSSVAPAPAAVPEPSAASSDAPAAAVDSSRVLPRWLSLNGGVGVGWISAPVKVRQRYEAGWDLDLGVEAQPHPRLRMRLNGEYQILPAINKGLYTIDNYFDEQGILRSDTLAFEFLTRGWLGAARLEAQAKLVPHVWLIGGIGRGYMGSGGRAYKFSSPFASLNVDFEGSNGWAWIPMIGARYDFDAFGPLIAVETRYSALHREHDVLHTWSIRLSGLRR